jgi:hypothetical protein
MRDYLLKSCLLASSAVGLSSPALAQQTAAITSPGRPQSERNWAEKMFSDLRLEMGTVAKGTTVQKTLTITNLYKEDITVSGLATSCGCFRAETDKKVLKTHEAATISVKMNTIDFRGERHANLNVTLQFQNAYKSVQVPLHGFIRTDVTIEPGFLNLGTVEQGQGATKSVTVKFSGRQGMRVQQVRSNNPLIKTEVKQRNSGFGSESDILVTLDASAPLGAVRDMLTIVTNDANNSEMQVDVAGKVEPDLVLTPSVLTLGKLRPGVEKTFSIVLRGHRPFAIEKLERDSPVNCWVSKYSKDTRSVHPIMMTIKPPETPGDYSETFALSIPGRKEPITFTAKGTIMGVEDQVDQVSADKPVIP